MKISGWSEVMDENTPLPKSALEALPVRAWNVINKMTFPKTYGGIKTVTREMIMAVQNSGTKTAQQIMAFRDACLNGTIMPDGQMDPSRADDPLPEPSVLRLSRRTRNILAKYGIEKTARGICALDREAIANFDGAGKLVAEELMELKKRCLNGDVWEDEVEVTAENGGTDSQVHPEGFNSLSEYVLAVAAKICPVDERRQKVMADYLGLLNVERVKVLRELGEELGGVTTERIRQLAGKLEKCMFSERGKELFAEFVKSAESIFSQGNGVIKEGELAAGLEGIYPNWTGTTEFSALRLLECCGIEIERNASGRVAWMTGGGVEKRYRAYLDLLENQNVPLESLTQDAVLQYAASLGLDGMKEDEFRFLLQRIFDRNRRMKGKNKARWSLFLRLRCGLHTSATERRRYVVARALRKAGWQGLAHAELVNACREIDPKVDIGGARMLLADASPQQKYDMDGTGARLIIYDFKGDGAGEKKVSLDVFFKDDELVRVVKEAGERLRRHMEENCLGVANITRLVKEIKDFLPEPYADGLPSACLYALMREHKAGGLRYYNHPNVAHPKILDKDGKVPELALSWLIYEYFLKAGHDTATSAQLVDFCVNKLWMDGAIASATALHAIKGEKNIVNGEERYRLKAPNPAIIPPNVLIEGGEIDSSLSFSESGGPQRMNRNADGRALNFTTYVRDFLLRLKESGYAFTEAEEKELADPKWCSRNFGIKKPVFVYSSPGSTRPNSNYWRVPYCVGLTRYWVNSIWQDKNKRLFDDWACSLASRAGFSFEPYRIPTEG